ncbi:uncharacterized protein LOC112348389 [Selaginella moellendorffii]|uniref:uncharacterized protein LOC112348389 n=1 Tax=Selaginella moellendorffii TaxID=88036 RepID=UPI000D1CE1F3|nr:uncharacterized protein LOC112348389 [Selaginella moellendorffii]|eukprot:XP_024536542.1 uncharacterized protein LOC112348389 [Selaginella moellendorffii]
MAQIYSLCSRAKVCPTIPSLRQGEEASDRGADRAADEGISPGFSVDAAVIATAGYNAEELKKLCNDSAGLRAIDRNNLEAHGGSLRQGVHGADLEDFMEARFKGCLLRRNTENRLGFDLRAYKSSQ